MSDNEICVLIKYIKSVLWRVAKGLSYIEDARCLKGNLVGKSINSTKGRYCNGRLFGFLVPTLRRNTPSLHGVKSMKTTII